MLLARSWKLFGNRWPNLLRASNFEIRGQDQISLSRFYLVPLFGAGQRHSRSKGELVRRSHSIDRNITEVRKIFADINQAYDIIAKILCREDR